jgi:thiol-disulfide isomerase/thioredoxin
MSIRKLLTLFGVMVVLACVLTYYVGIRGPRVAPSTDIGSVSRGLIAPNFTLADLTGKKVSLEDFRGQIVLVNFWATWCEPCLEEMPSLQSLYEKFKGRKLVILAVNVNETGQDLENYLKTTTISFPILLEGQSTAQRYGTDKYPESYLIDNRGIVIQKIIGPQNWMHEEAIKYFDGLLPESSS